MESHLNLIHKKIYNQESDYLQFINLWKFQDKKIIFTNGCFDIIHRGHIEYLSKAADYGNILIVGLNSDFSVKSLKGDSRPIQDQYSRALILASLSFINLVVIFNDNTPINLIKGISPDILVKGGDYKIENIVGADFISNNGGKVVTIPFIEGFSSSNIINSF